MDKSKEIFNESSLARLYAHTKYKNIGIICATTDALAPEESKSASGSFQQDIREAGYGFIPIVGTWSENVGTPNEVKGTERFYLLIGNDHDSGNLKGFLRKQGIRYRQEAFIQRPYGSEEMELHMRTGEVVKIGPWHPGRIGELYSMLRAKPPRFTFEKVRFIKADTFFSSLAKHVSGKRGIEDDF